jgi:hypothetical protein
MTAADSDGPGSVEDGIPARRAPRALARSAGKAPGAR